VRYPAHCRTVAASCHEPRVWPPPWSNSTTGALAGPPSSATMVRPFAPLNSRRCESSWTFIVSPLIGSSGVKAMLSEKGGQKVSHLQIVEIGKWKVGIAVQSGIRKSQHLHMPTAAIDRIGELLRSLDVEPPKLHAGDYAGVRRFYVITVYELDRE